MTLPRCAANVIDLGFPRPSYDRALNALRTWLGSWSGVGRIAVGMTRQGYDRQLTRYEHSPTSATGTAWERTPWRAVQGAARDALRRADA